MTNYRQLITIAFLFGMAVWMGYEDLRCARFALVAAAVVFLVLALNELKRALTAGRKSLRLGAGG